MFRRLFLKTVKSASAGACGSGQVQMAAAPAVVAGRVTEAALSKLTTEVFMKEIQRALSKVGGSLGQLADVVLRVVQSRATFIVDFIKAHPTLSSGPLLAAFAVALVYAVYKGINALSQPITDIQALANRLISDITTPWVSPEMPDDFVCPITHEPFVDPVIVVPSGHTYERQALEEWMRINPTNPTDPMTRESIASVTPNRALKNTMDRWYSALINVVPPAEVVEVGPVVEEIWPGIEIAFE